MERLLTALAQVWPNSGLLHDITTAWPGDIGPNGASLPLRIASGLHWLVLSGQDTALAQVYPPNRCEDIALAEALTRALLRHDAHLADWIQQAPQTNEVRRSAALIPGAHWLAQRTHLPLRLSELGASGGLNLAFDRFALDTGAIRFGPADAPVVLRPEWQGGSPKASELNVAERAGVDLNPLDPRDPDEALRLLSYIWPDQPERLSRTRAAITQATGRVDRGDAVDWLESRLRTRRPGTTDLIYHTIAWQYFPADRQRRGQALIEAAGDHATPDAPLAWLSMEHDGDSASGDGAALTIRVWPDGAETLLARVDFQGRWVRWLAD